jgi:alpha-glucosidase
MDKFPFNLKRFYFVTILLLLPFIFAVAGVNKDKLSCSSPDGKIRAIFSLVKDKPVYAVLYGKDTLIRPSELGFVLKDNDSLCRFRLIATTENTFNETWQPVWGITSQIKNEYHELKIELEDLRKSRKMWVFFRCYNDGFAFRYAFPEQNGLKDFIIMSEESRIRLAGSWECWWSWADYNTLEKKYMHQPSDSAKHAATPFTLKSKNGCYLSIHEAAVDDYSTMTLLQEKPGCFKVNLVPWADGSAVKAAAPMQSPWRVFFISKRAGALLESNLLLNLNEPCAIKDVSWIKPMTYCGIWWEMHLGISGWAAGPRHGATTENAKRYIDFAAGNGIKGFLAEGWNTGWENWGKPGAFDYITPYPDYDLEEVVKYAKTKGIAYIGHHETGGDCSGYDTLAEKAFARFKELGIHAVKTGYAGGMIPLGEYHHGQAKVRHCNAIMKLAAKYEIMLDVHEPAPLSGLSRTWPNLMSAEGARGMEWNAWSDGNAPTHTCTLPFTRLMAGPMDYTPGIFDIDFSAHEKDRIRWNSSDSLKTSVHSTLSNQLALMIVLFSPVQMAADLPENYTGHPASAFLRDLPATWDETRVLDAEIGEYIVMARRKGNSWYIGAITNDQSRNLTVDLHQLTTGKPFTLDACQDTPNAHYETNPEVYEILRVENCSRKSMELKLAPGGGCLMKLQLQ